MKRYLLFAGENYYPAGGMDDWKGDFTTLKNALTCAANTSCDWWHIWDSREKKIVAKS